MRNWEWLRLGQQNITRAYLISNYSILCVGFLYQSVKVSKKKKREMQRKMEKTQSHTHKHTLLLVATGALHAWYMWPKLQTLMCTRCLLDTCMSKPWGALACLFDTCGANLEMVCFVLETNGPNLKEVRVLLAWYMCVQTLRRCVSCLLACLIHVVQTLRFWLAWDNGGLNLEVGQGRRK